jgi:radical SAM superfamily enzyme YgiQ (UPF0313 family)
VTIGINIKDNTYYYFAVKGEFLIKENKALVYLCDLIHDYTKNSDSYYVLPLNIGLISAYCQQQLKDQVDIQLFKYPEKLETAVKIQKPDIIGFSFYTWNEELVHHFAGQVKKLYPDTLIVFGGPNLEASQTSFENFFYKYSFVDYYILYEGEEVFNEVVSQFLSVNKKIDKLKRIDIKGTVKQIDGKVEYSFLDPKSKDKKIPYPSPYLTGVLDEFLSDPFLYPLFETNRGCPFKCTFCAWGVSALDRVRMWPIEQIMKEFKYYLERCSGQDLWIFADANFGIVKRDVDVARKIREYKDHPRGPKRVLAWNSKNTTNRNIEVQEIFGDMSGFLVAFQSLDEEVLENIKRKNIKVEGLVDLVNYFKHKEADIETDILIGLPGESYESHIGTLRKCFDHDIRYIRGMNIRLLDGTVMSSEADIAEFGTRTKFRLIRDSYGKYWDKWIIDSEEIVRSTNALSESEMLDLRIIHYFIWLFWNIGVLQPLLVFGRVSGVNPIDMLAELAHNKNDISYEFGEIISNYLEDANREWFDTKEDLIAYYQENTDSIEDALDSSNNLNFIYTPKIFLDKKIFKSVLDFCSRYIEESSSNKSSVHDLQGVKKYTYDRALLDFKSLKEKKEIHMSVSTYEFLREENLLKEGIPYSNSHNGDVVFSVELKEYEFIKGELDKHNSLTPNDKMVNNAFLTSLFYQPIMQEHTSDKKRMKVMAGDSIF